MEQIQIKEKLYTNVMNEKWDAVVNMYKNSLSEVRHVKLTHSRDTALHMAVYEEKTVIVKELVRLIAEDINKGPKEKEDEVLKYLANDEGNNPLHVAAKLGNWKICFHIAYQLSCLIRCRNKDKGETPLFLAALHGKKKAFHILLFVYQHKFQSSDANFYEQGRRNIDGRTILHCAIDGEYFDLAYQIIKLLPKFLGFRDDRGYTPFHLLATKHSAFRSSCSLTWGQRFIYRCTPAKKPEKRYFGYFGLFTKLSHEAAKKVDSQTRLNFKVVSSASPKEEVPIEIKTEAFDTGIDSSSKSVNTENQMSTNRASPKEEVPIEIKTEASDTGIGSSSKSVNTENQMSTDRHLMMRPLFPKHMVKMRETHLRANAINNVILGRVSVYKELVDSGNKPESGSDSMFWDQKQLDGTPPDDQDNQTVGKDASDSPTCSISTLSFPLNEVGNDVARSPTTVTASLVSLKSSTSNDRKIETPILIAAKNGIEEIVESILKNFKVAMHDVNSDGKNLMILAVENRQPQMYQLLVKMGKKEKKEKIIRDLFLGVDKKGNSALHLAAELKTYQPWRAPDAILQMQWEIKWYECIKEKMPQHLLGHKNKKGKTAEEIFMETHKELVEKDIEWLTKTSDACTIVAALIATVAFATSVSVPGGTKGHGEPVLGREPMFEIFSFSSLGTLCFSLTAVVMFLAILTSRHQPPDFGCILPTKLLIGLTALFLSIASVLVSFCGGHFFIVRDILKDAKAVEYVVAVIPVLVFAIAQFPLYFKLIWATMKKVPDRGFMATSAGVDAGSQASSN